MLWGDGSSSGNNNREVRFMNSQTPIFSQFGQDIYHSDVVKTCTSIIASEISKLKPKHIRTNSEGIQTRVNSSIDRLFKFAPNDLMTTRDFLEKVAWLYIRNHNAFIYPVYEERRIKEGQYIRNYKSFYPLNPTVVTFGQDSLNRLFIEMTFENGDKFTMPYSDIIHLRKEFGMNDIMGGGLDGNPDNTDLLKVLSIDDSVMQGLDKGVKTSMTLRGILNVNTMKHDKAQREELEKFEAKMKDSKSGIVPLDLKGEYIDLKPDPKLIDKETLSFLQDKILNRLGVSLPIYSGKFTDEDYQAFYEKTLEPIVIMLHQAFSKTCFTNRELEMGNELIFYQKDMMYLSTKAKIELLKSAGEQGLLSDNQKLAIIGYPPIEGGERRTQSLNYIDVDLINQYQMSRKNNTQGGSLND